MIASVLLAVTLGSTAPASFEQAVERERRLLTEEKAALEAALRTQASARVTAETALEQEIDRLATDLARIEADNASRELRLPAKEQTRSSHAQDRHLKDLLEEMGQWLRQRGEDPPTIADPTALVEAVKRITGRIEADGALQVESERIFDGQGVAQEREVLRVSRVAAVRWDDAMPLVQSAAGPPVVASIEPLRTLDGQGQQVRVVLHDPNHPPDPRGYRSDSWAERMEVGGELMWVLLALGVAALLIAVERALFLGWVAWRWHRIREPQTAALGPAWLAEPWRRLLLAPALGLSALEERIAQAVLVVRERLTQRLTLLNVVAGVAPLVGLLGTVSGMITTFSVVTTKGTDDPQLLAGGISEALLTTQFGLAIAIPTVIVHAILSRSARRLILHIEHALAAALPPGGEDAE